MRGNGKIVNRSYFDYFLFFLSLHCKDNRARPKGSYLRVPSYNLVLFFIFCGFCLEV
jgi:hypothetical protein